MKGGFMGRAWRYYVLVLMVGVFLIAVQLATGEAQEKIRIAYSSTDTLNSIWTVADGAGFYKKHGLDAEVVYIGSTTVGVAAIVSQDVQVGNAAGSGVANAVVRGADTVSVACFIYFLAYQLTVTHIVQSPQIL